MCAARCEYSVVLIPCLCLRIPDYRYVILERRKKIREIELGDDQKTEKKYHEKGKKRNEEVRDIKSAVKGEKKEKGSKGARWEDIR